MNKKELRANTLLLLTAIIWGFAFVAQRVGAEFVGAFTFNGIRFAIGSASLVPLIFILDKKQDEIQENKENKKHTLVAGIILGVILFVASALQQAGVSHTTAGKAGFITGLYMVLVPIFGLFLKQKTNRNTWISVVVAVIGLYLLSINEDLSIGYGDFLVLLGTIFWATHILFIDNFTKKYSPLKLSCIQFAVCSILSIVSALIFETITMEAIKGAGTAILYGGILSVGVAYTLQVVAQKDAKPTHAAIILSLESVFGAIGGALMLGESMTTRGYVGCVLIFIAIIFSQIKAPEKKGVSESL